MSDTKQKQKINPKAHYDPKSVEEWREILGNDSRGGFLIFRELYRSSAFLELSKHPKHVLVLLEALSQLNMEKKNRNDSRPRQTKYKNGGIVYVTQNRLKAVGVGVTTQVEAKKALVMLGFLDVAATDAVANNDGKFQPSVFRVSDRWRKHPNVPPQEDGIQITRQLYREHSLSNPNHPIHRKRCEAEQKRIQKLNANPIQELNAADSKPIQKLNTSARRSTQNHRSKTECILKDFQAVQGDSKSRVELNRTRRSNSTPHTIRTSHSPITESRGGAPKHQASKYSFVEGGAVSSLDPEVLKMGIPAEILARMGSSGHMCTLAQKRGPNQVQLDFSNGCTVYVRPREYELVANNGGYIRKFHGLDELTSLLPVSAEAMEGKRSPIATRIKETNFDPENGRWVTPDNRNSEPHLEPADLSRRLIGWRCSSCTHFDESAEHVLCGADTEPLDLTAPEAACPKRRK